MSLPCFRFCLASCFSQKKGHILGGQQGLHAASSHPPSPFPSPTRGTSHTGLFVQLSQAASPHTPALLTRAQPPCAHEELRPVIQNTAHTSSPQKGLSLSPHLKLSPHPVQCSSPCLGFKVCPIYLPHHTHCHSQMGWPHVQEGTIFFLI